MAMAILLANQHCGHLSPLCVSGPQWDPKVYPDPAAMVAELKEINTQLMVSVWSKFDTKTTFYAQMQAEGWLLGS